MNRIASLEDGAATYLTGQHHNWQVVPPAHRPSAQYSSAQDMNAEVRFTVMLYIITSR